MASDHNSIELLTIKLKRHAPNVSWGFNIQGGREFSSPLIIQKVDILFFLSFFKFFSIDPLGKLISSKFFSCNIRSHRIVWLTKCR